MREADPAGPFVGDAFGEALLRQLDTGSAELMIERDDGLINLDTLDYFSPPDEPSWSWIRSRLGDRVLDIGCGAGRGCLALQDLGVEVVGLDVSPGAIEASRRRGVTHTFLGTVDDLACTGPEPFDSFLCLGNNLGLLAGPDQAAVFLGTLAALGHPGSNLVGTMLDGSAEDGLINLAYRRANRRAGRMEGEVRIRDRHLRTATDWHRLLWCSPDELAEVVVVAGWEITDTLPGSTYAAELRPISGSPANRV